MVRTAAARGDPAPDVVGREHVGPPLGVLGGHVGVLAVVLPVLLLAALGEAQLAGPAGPFDGAPGGHLADHGGGGLLVRALVLGTGVGGLQGGPAAVYGRVHGGADEHRERDHEDPQQYGHRRGQ